MKRLLLSTLVLFFAASGFASGEIEMSCVAKHNASGKEFYATGLKWTGSSRAMSACTDWAKANNQDEASCQVTCEPVFNLPY
jgi:hypothetical protein